MSVSVCSVLLQHSKGQLGTVPRAHDIEAPCRLGRFPSAGCVPVRPVSPSKQTASHVRSSEEKESLLLAVGEPGLECDRMTSPKTAKHRVLPLRGRPSALANSSGRLPISAWSGSSLDLKQQISEADFGSGI